MQFHCVSHCVHFHCELHYVVSLCTSLCTDSLCTLHCVPKELDDMDMDSEPATFALQVKAIITRRMQSAIPFFTTAAVLLTCLLFYLSHHRTSHVLLTKLSSAFKNLCHQGRGVKINSPGITKGVKQFNH